MVPTYIEEIERDARALAQNHTRIKAFVTHYHARASLLLTLAARACEGDERAQSELAEHAQSSDEAADAVDLVRCLGPSASVILPEIITAYYGGTTIDAFA